jgi:hypothetical protein
MQDRQHAEQQRARARAEGAGALQQRDAVGGAEPFEAPLVPPHVVDAERGEVDRIRARGQFGQFRRQERAAPLADAPLQQLQESVLGDDVGVAAQQPRRGLEAGVGGGPRMGCEHDR